MDIENLQFLTITFLYLRNNMTGYCEMLIGSHKCLAASVLETTAFLGFGLSVEPWSVGLGLKVSRPTALVTTALYII